MEKGEERGRGPTVGCHAAWGRRGAWPRPAGGASTVSRSAMTRAWRARAARRCSDRGASGADGQAPVAVRVGRERRGAHDARACMGRPEKKTGWLSPVEQYGFRFI
jgi:hypothetical protein